MTQNTALKAEPRTANGKGAARSLRREKKVPAIIYGGKGDNLPVSLQLNEVVREIAKPGFMSRVLDLKIGNDTVSVLPKSIDTDPVTDIPEHADFLRVEKGVAIKVLVSVNFLHRDRCKGIRRGGALNIVRRELELLAAPENIPTHIDIDLRDLDIGQSLHISHVKLPEGVSPYISDRDFTIATVVGRGKAAADTDAAEGEGEEGEGEE